jgi:PAS domain S-box-containing protein
VLVNKFGKEFPILDSAAPVKRNNETIGVVLVFRDQTAERKKQKQLEEREQFQSFLISNLPGFVYRCAFDKNWTMLYISEGCKELTGYSPQEFINGNPVFNDIIHPDYQELLFNIWEDALRKKEVFEYEYPIITKSENVKWVWERGSGIFSSSGELLYLEGFITDITEKKLYQLQIEESEKKLRTVTNLISDYLFSSKIEKDGTSKKNWIFGAFEEITGYTIEEYTSIGGWRACLHPDDVEIDNQAHQKLLNNQEIVCELRTIHKSGKIVWVKIYAHPIWDDNENRVTEIIGAVQDITNTKKSELFSKIQVIISEAIIKYKSEIELYDIILRELSQIIDIKNFFVAYFNKENGLLQSILEADEKDNIPVWRAKGSLTGYLWNRRKLYVLKGRS